MTKLVKIEEKDMNTKTQRKIRKKCMQRKSEEQTLCSL